MTGEYEENDPCPVFFIICLKRCTLISGLRSPSLGDQLATVASTASLVEAHPFPMYVNMIVVRLADAFKDGYVFLYSICIQIFVTLSILFSSNPLRMTIARVLSECRSHLSLVFSGSEIFKRFLSVSHSNDPVARAMTLQVDLCSIFFLIIG